MPGFTPTSVYAKLIDASGIGYAELVDRLCRLALERAAREGARQSATP
jgi:D-alanine-D-alanine ligase